MNKLVYIITVLVALLFAGCDKSVEEENGLKTIVGYKELLEAHQAGLIFKEVIKLTDGTSVFFEDGSRIIVPHSSFLIHDHTDSNVPEVRAIAGATCWSVGGQLTSINILPGDTPNVKAEPVYVYYNARILFMHLSNRQVLEFPTKAQVMEDELERMQNLPSIYIDTGGKGIWSKENYVDGTITIKDPEKLYSNVSEFNAAMGIRGRGNSTWSFPKKPYKVKLKEKASIT